MSSYMDLVSNPAFIKAVAVELAKQPELLELIAKAALGNVATKDDIKDLVAYINSVKEDLVRYVDAKFSDAISRIDSLDKRIAFLQWTIMIWPTVLSMLITISFFVP
ncbi:MAG: hypothetical protein Q6363_005125 [Candidatus Njordarchaeota archaeon]